MTLQLLALECLSIVGLNAKEKLRTRTVERVQGKEQPISSREEREENFHSFLTIDEVWWRLSKLKVGKDHTMIGCEGGIWPVDDLGRAKNQFLQHRGSSKDVIEPGITIRLGPMVGPSMPPGILAVHHRRQHGIVDL